MVIVDILINNVNWIVVDVWVVFGKNGGNMGVFGVVFYMFDNIVIFVFVGEDVDEIFEYLMEKDIDVCDVMEEDG